MTIAIDTGVGRQGGPAAMSAAVETVCVLKEAAAPLATAAATAAAPLKDPPESMEVFSAPDGQWIERSELDQKKGKVVRKMTLTEGNTK